ncbi:hypothetical protein HU200_040956 [Digitaria exilis]|uniref:Late embryogenesis abundant protein LEA-2 subgroup domain-containing protein n=1 Tax=Digitaria exilis TaxID=1010633 RepID=A0A835EJI7_9POAL|nr:hypothetical protein HU200_040956 [Digitaria exilis]
MCCLDDDCCCCGGCYDTFCDRCCPCISYDTREAIFGICICLLLLSAVALVAVLLAAYGFIRHVEVAVEDASLVSISVTDASLTHFTLSTSPVTSLFYNLSLTLVIHNPNWAMGLKNTKPLEASYKFDGQVFDRYELAGKGGKHPPGKTRVYHIDGGGGAARPVVLGNAGEVEYRRENRTGVFEVEVDVTGEVRYTLRYTRLQLGGGDGGGGGAVVFQRVKCKLAKAEKNC